MPDRKLRTIVLVSIFLGCGTALLRAEDLPTDERVKTGKLANGVKWVYRQHAFPPGKMALLIHVDSGSLNETDEQRGIAHFLEHMAFNGTENFAPGKLIPYFESIGMEFGPDLNAFTSFDQTTFMLFLPNTDPNTIDRGLMVLSDYAFRQSLVPGEIDRERGVILSEKRAGKSAQQRLNDEMMKRLFAGMRVGERLPIGTEEVISNAPPTVFESYYRTWYRPERMTLIMVGDAEPSPYFASVEKWFGQYKAATPAKKDLGTGLRPFTQEHAIVLSDPEYAECDVQITSLLPAEPPTTTVELARRDLLDEIGTWIMNRRLSEKVRKGEASFRQGHALVSRFLKDAVRADAGAAGEPKNWEKMLDELVQELNQARTYGFLPGELELARRALLANAEDDLQKEPTKPARQLAFEYLRCIRESEPIMSAQQDLDVLKKLLPSITIEEVNRTFADQFKPGAYAYVLTLPGKDDVKLPSEDELLAAARAAQARQLAAPNWEERPTALLEREPVPGKLVESARDADLGITDGWLANGVRLHHRFMDYKKDYVRVTIGLAGGQIQETAENAGVTAVASLALNQAATQRLSSSEIRDIMTGKRISLRAFPIEDVLVLSLEGSPQDLETGLQLAHALLTGAKLEQSAFDHWKEAALQQYAMGSQRPDMMALNTTVKLLAGDDPRRMFLITPEQVARLSVPLAQAWLEKLCRAAPIEASVVGEVQLEQVLPLLEKYIGSLPQRARRPEHLDQLRTLPRGTGPLEKRVDVDTVTPKAMTVDGFIAADVRDIQDVRALNLVANVLDSRLIKRIRQELGMVYSIGAENTPGGAYRDSGLLMSRAPCAPDKAQDLAREIEAVFSDFAERGPTAEELENAKKQWQNKLDVQLKEPSFWSGQLQTFDLRGLKLADLKNIPASYAALTAEQAQAVFCKYYKPERQFRVFAIPTRPTAEDGAGAKPGAKTAAPSDADLGAAIRTAIEARQQQKAATQPAGNPTGQK